MTHGRMDGSGLNATAFYGGMWGPRYINCQSGTRAGVAGIADSSILDDGSETIKRRRLIIRL